MSVGIWFGIEVGYLAWLIGFLSGYGADIGAGSKRLGWASGLVAVVLAVLSISCAKHLVFKQQVRQFKDQLSTISVEEDQLIASIAKKLLAPPHENHESGVTTPNIVGDDVSSWFSPDVWLSAKQRWNDLPVNVQRERIQRRTETMEIAKQRQLEKVASTTFLGLFPVHGFDALWFALACFSAYRIGSGRIDRQA